MSGNQRQAASSSGSENSTPEEERKRKRMISNRESARRSRMRKQKQLEDLLSEVTNLQTQNAQLRQSIDLAAQRYVQMESSNNVLRAQATELTEHLRSLNAVLQIVEEVPDSILEPWQLLPCPVHVASSVDMFQC